MRLTINCNNFWETEKKAFFIAFFCAVSIHVVGLLALLQYEKPVLLQTKPPVIPIEITLIAEPIPDTSEAVQPVKSVVQNPVLLKKPTPLKKLVENPAKRVVKKSVVPKANTAEKQVVEPKVIKPVLETKTGAAVKEPVSAAVENNTETSTDVTETENRTIPIVQQVRLNGKRVAPVYPKRALRLRQEGVVWVQVLVAESGKQQRLKIVKNSNYPLLDKAALEAIKQWRFKPTVRNGTEIASWVEVPIEFQIR